MPLQWGVVIGASLVAAVWDIAKGRIPNFLTFPVLLAGLVWAGWVGRLAGLLEALAACLLLAFPYVVLFLKVGGGAGDAKLMGAIGAWLGLLNGIIALFCVAVSGIVLALSFAWVAGRLRSTTRDAALIVLSWLWRGPQPATGSGRTDLTGAASGRTMPYGVAILGGVAVAAVGVWLWRT